MNLTQIRLLTMVLIGGLILPSLSLMPRSVAAQTTSVTIEQAIQIATDYLGGGVAYKAKLEDKYGSLEYKVNFTNGYRVYVDANSGDVVWTSQKRAKRYAAEMEQLPIRLIPAIQIATNARNGGVVYEAKLHDPAREWEYKVKFTDGIWVYVDATTGAVLDSRRGGRGDRGDRGDRRRP